MTSEQPVEEDYWAEAEFALIVWEWMWLTSLGYLSLDDTTMNYRYRDLDGHYSSMSHSAFGQLIAIGWHGVWKFGAWHMEKISTSGRCEITLWQWGGGPNLVNADFSPVEILQMAV